jgi:hypothetical protein
MSLQPQFLVVAFFPNLIHFNNFSSIRKNNLKIVHKLFQLYQQNIAPKKKKNIIAK